MLPPMNPDAAHPDWRSRSAQDSEGKPAEWEERIEELERTIAALRRDLEDRKQIEERLQRSERNLAEGQRLTKTGSWVLDFPTGNTDWSVETCRIFGFPDPPPSPHYREFRARVHAEDREGVDRGLRESFTTGEPRPLKYRFLLPDGVLKHIETISQPVWDEAGVVVRLMGTVMDVTERVQAQEALQRSKDDLRIAIDTIPGLVWTSRPDGQIEYLNKRWLDYTGLTLAEGAGWGWQRAIHPGDLEGLGAYWRSILASGEAGEYEARLRRFDGTIRWFLFRGVPLHDENGRLVKWYGTNTDIHEQKRAAELVAGEKRLLEMIAQGDALLLILEALCRLAEKLAGDVLVSILLTSPDGKRLHHGAAPNLPQPYIEAINGGAIGPCAGSCGTAAFRREPVIVTDIMSDPLWHDYRDAARVHDLHACWSTPIFSSTREVLGTFALYQRKAGSPPPEQHGIVDRFAHLASIAIERTLAQAALHRSEAYLTEAQRLSLTGSFGWCVATGEIVWSEETYRILAYDRTATPTLAMIFQRVHPEDLAFVRRTLEEVSHAAQDADFEHRLLMPDGSVKHVHVLARATHTASGLEFVGALMDITEHRQTAEALRVSERLARGQAEALTHALDALARESSPDRIVEHVLRTLTQQLDAHSSSVWLRDEASGLMVFEFALEEGAFRTKNHEQLAQISPSLQIDDVWPWPEVFRTGRPYLLEDIRSGPEFPWRAHVLSLGVVSILIVPMLIAGRVEGVIGIRFSHPRSFRAGEMELAQALTNQAMLAMQLMRLSEQSRQSAVIAERNRMARDIHDTLAQGFTGVIVQLEAAADATSQGLGGEAGAHVDRAAQLARRSLQEARRSVQALRPQALEEKSLCGALEELLHKTTAGTALRVKFTVRGQPRALPPDWDENVLRIGQEVLTNALRHAHANQFDAQLEFTPDELRLEFKDNGRGFDLTAKHEGFGLLGIRERAELLGGKLFSKSTAEDGTAFLIVLPLV